jgi:hypothetical protein
MRGELPRGSVGSTVLLDSAWRTNTAHGLALVALLCCRLNAIGRFTAGYLQPEAPSWKGVAQVGYWFGIHANSCGYAG